MPRSTIAIATRDGHCETSVFVPSSSTGAWPAIIFYMDGLGIRAALYEMGERMAAHGYLVLLPDLFYRQGPYHPDAKAFFGDPEARKAWVAKYIASVTIDDAREDTRALLSYLDTRNDVIGPKVGTTGYCMGGHVSIAMAGSFPERIAAAASYHGSRLATDDPRSPHLLAPHIKARVYVAGATDDPSFPEAQKERLEAALMQANVDHSIETYDAKHGWVPSDTPVHDPVAAERHWQTLFALFDSVLPR